MKKVKIAIGLLVVFLAMAVAIITALGMISKRNNLYGTQSRNLSVSELTAPSDFTGGGMMKAEAPLAHDSENSLLDLPSDQKVIKNGNLTLRVGSVDRAAEEISDIAKNNNGQIFSSNIYQSKADVKSGSVTLKVPVNNFEKTISEVKKIATLVVREFTSGQDVTEEYQDLQGQLKNKQAEEQSFTRILNQAQKIDDILAVTRELSRVRGEIESLEGRIKFLNSQTDMATISANITEDQNVTMVDSWRPFQIAKEAVNSLIRMAQGFIGFLIVFVITVIPVAFLYLLTIFVIYLIGKKIYRKIRKNKENGATNNQ